MELFPEGREVIVATEVKGLVTLDDMAVDNAELGSIDGGDKVVVFIEPGVELLGGGIEVTDGKTVIVTTEVNGDVQVDDVARFERAAVRNAVEHHLVH